MRGDIDWGVAESVGAPTLTGAACMSADQQIKTRLADAVLTITLDNPPDGLMTDAMA